MVMTRFTSQLIFSGSILFGLSPAYAENLEPDIVLALLRELAATTNVQQQILSDRQDTAFSDASAEYGGMLAFSFEKIFQLDEWKVSVVSGQRTDGTYVKTLYFIPNFDYPISNETDLDYEQTFCSDLDYLIVSVFGEPQVRLDTSTPMASESNLISYSNLEANWTFNGLGFHSFCSATHMRSSAGTVETMSPMAAISLTTVEDMTIIMPLVPISCTYSGTWHSSAYGNYDQTFTLDFYLDETHSQILSLDKTILASDAHFTEGAISGTWRDAQFVRELSFNRYTGTSRIEATSLTADKVSIFTTNIGECLTNTERKF